ncbi:hypothetical protein BsWGS_04655 [Bradybaena similaris]
MGLNRLQNRGFLITVIIIITNSYKHNTRRYPLVYKKRATCFGYKHWPLVRNSYHPEMLPSDQKQLYLSALSTSIWSETASTSSKHWPLVTNSYICQVPNTCLWSEKATSLSSKHWQLVRNSYKYQLKMLPCRQKHLNLRLQPLTSSQKHL